MINHSLLANHLALRGPWFVSGSRRPAQACVTRDDNYVMPRPAAQA